MVEQVRTRRVKMSTVARNPAFRAGIRDFTKGTTPAFDQVYSQARGQSVTDSAWAYERGRLFAAWTKGAGRKIPAPWFVDRRLSGDVLEAMREAFYQQAFR